MVTSSNKLSKKTLKSPLVKKTRVKKSVSLKTSKVAKSSTTKNSTKKTKERSQHCIVVCGKDRCVSACTPVTGTCIPCPICHHGHFCENDYTCLSCGATRGLKIKPYKGA